MPRKIAFNLATVDGPVACEGETIWIAVKEGAKPVKFVAHEYAGRTVLTHWASGQRVGDLGGIKLQYAVAWGTYGAPLTNRAAAHALIEKAVLVNGAQVVLDKLAAAPVINR